MTQALVDQLETVQVQEEQGREPPRALRRRQRESEPVDQELAVGETSEGVVEGQAGKLELAMHALDRVADAPREQAAVDLPADQVVLSALVHGLDCELLVLRSAEDHDGSLRREPSDLRERPEPVRVGLRDVEQDAVELTRAEVGAGGGERSVPAELDLARNCRVERRSQSGGVIGSGLEHENAQGSRRSWERARRCVEPRAGHS